VSKYTERSVHIRAKKNGPGLALPKGSVFLAAQMAKFEKESRTRESIIPAIVSKKSFIPSSP
jgi:hypothetical protein